MILKLKRKFLIITIFIIYQHLLPIHSFASESLSYTGRLVNTNGSPVAGPVDLKLELIYSSDPETILCTKLIEEIELTNGVFHLQIDYTPENCGNKSLTQVLTDVPNSSNISLIITDQTNLSQPPKVYPAQSIHSVPYSGVAAIAKNLVQMDASEGQVLKWDGSKWSPSDPEALLQPIDSNLINDSAVTNSKIASDAAISRSKIASGAQNYVLVNDSSGVMTEVSYLSIEQGGTGANNSSDAITNLGLGNAALANIGTAAGNVLGVDQLFSCLESQKLKWNLLPVAGWTCIEDTDSTKLPLAGGTMTGDIDMGTKKITNLPAPAADADAATKAYVDTQITSIEITAGDIDTNLIADNAITNAKVASDAAIDRSKLANGTANYVLVNNGSGVMSEVATLPLAQGGTGASTAAGARTNLELGTAAVANIGTASGNVLGVDNLPTCFSNEKLKWTPFPTSSWSCAADSDTTKLPLSGGTMSGNVSMGSNKITSLADPSSSTDATNKSYVDTQITNNSYWTNSSGNINRSTGNVGIGVSSPIVKLDVAGQIRPSMGTIATNPTNNAVDFSTGNTQFVTFTSCSGNALTVNLFSMLEGGSYSLMITTPSGCQISFTGTSAANGGTGGVAVTSFKFPAGATYSSTENPSVYSFLRANNIVFGSQVVDFR